MALKLIVNASPLIFLSKTELIEMLPKMSESLIIPRGVLNEIEKHHDEAFQWTQIHGNKYVRETENIPDYISAWDLGAGESEVITQALKHDDHTVVLDDKAARNCAHSMQLKVIGTIGLIILAKRTGLVDDAVKYLHRLKGAGFRIDTDLFSEALRLAND